MEKLEHFIPSFRRPNARKRSAFSLVEVTLAIGVMAFALLAIFGLLPTGMGVFRQALDTSVSSQIIQRVLNDARETDFAYLIQDASNQTITAPTGVKAVRYFDDQGNELSVPAGAIYQVNTRIMPQTTLPTTDPNALANTNLATVTVQVANNPGNQLLASGTNNLWTGAYQTNTANTGVVPMITYSAVVSRNK